MENRERPLICNSCGAGLEYSPGARALKCLYCGTVTQIERVADKVDEANEVGGAHPAGPDELIVPLTVTKAQLQDAVRQFLAQGKYTPDGLIEQAAFRTVEQFYVPAYVYTGGFQAQWSASFGFDRTETYTEYERDSDGNSKPVTKSRTVTDWSPASGQDIGSFGVATYAGSRLKQSALPLVASLVENCRGVAGATPYDASYTSGIEVEPFSVAEPEAYRDRGEAQVDVIIEQSVKANRQGDRQSDWHWTASIGKQYSKLLVPVCHVVYEYEGKTYEVWVDGSNTDNLVADPAPVDAKRKSAVRRGYIPGVVATLWALLVLVVEDLPNGIEHPFMLFMSLFMAWRYGVDRRNSILKYSQRLRDAVLAQRRLASAMAAELTDVQRGELVTASTRPKRRWLATTSRDWLVLPLFSLLGILLVQASLLPSKPAASVAASTSATEQATATAQASVQPEASSTQPVAAADQPAFAPKTAPGTDVDAVFELATVGEWGQVDKRLAHMKSNAAKPAADRDEFTAHRANVEGEAAFKRRNFDGAYAAFQRAVQADPTNIRYLKNLANLLGVGGQQSQAVSTYEKVLLLAPRDADTWIDMAANLVEIGQRPRARIALMMALHVSPNREKTLELLRQQSTSGRSDDVRSINAAVYKEATYKPS